MYTDVDKFDLIFANKVIAFNDIGDFIDRVKDCLNPGGAFVCISPVLDEEEYSRKLQTISVPRKDLMILLKQNFNTVVIVDKYDFDINGCEITTVCKNPILQ